MYNFCSASECGDTASVSTMVISGDEGGPSSSEEDVLVDDEEELPQSCGLLVNSIVIYNYWASEASPTLGCSIEIPRDIYICRYVCHVLKCVGGITYAHAQSQFWAVKTDL